MTSEKGKLHYACIYSAIIKIIYRNVKVKNHLESGQILLSIPMGVGSFVQALNAIRAAF
jgi:hypothetical protein